MGKLLALAATFDFALAAVLSVLGVHTGFPFLFTGLALLAAAFVV